MGKREKTYAAAGNSTRYMGRTVLGAYTSVDGRTYTPEKRLPSTEPYQKTLYRHIGDGWPSLIEIYRCEHYLSGRGIYSKPYIPAAEKETLMAELDLVFDERKRRYTMDPDKIWAHFQEKYPEKIAKERITSYGELAYRAKYRN